MLIVLFRLVFFSPLPETISRAVSIYSSTDHRFDSQITTRVSTSQWIRRRRRRQQLLWTSTCWRQLVPLFDARPRDRDSWTILCTCFLSQDSPLIANRSHDDDNHSIVVRSFMFPNFPFIRIKMDRIMWVTRRERERKELSTWVSLMDSTDIIWMADGTRAV